MEKVYLKPTAREIIIKGSAAQRGEHADIFSYDAESDEAARTLGSLFVLGHVQHETTDVAYMVNLIAALAKREYYAKPSLEPKDAFANTLRKVNEVAEEFFKNKGLTINTGIFAIAGEQIFISRLGKFKIVLSREGKVTDILNNIQEFTKEHLEDREFSNIISGKVLNGDRILAYYPNQQITSRERTIKTTLTKGSGDEFAEKINSIKATNEQFACTLLYVNMETVKESAVAPIIQPEELAGASLATSVAPRRTTRPRAAKIQPDLSPKSRMVEPATSTISAVPEPLPASSPSLPLSTAPEVSDEPPRIIPSEFSSARRQNFVTSFISKFRLPRLRGNQKIAAGVVAVVIVAGLGFAAKALFLIDPETKRANEALSNTQAEIATARAGMESNAAQSRSSLLASLSTLSALTDSEKKTAAQKEIDGLLDSIDKVSDASPTLVYQVPDSSGQPLLLNADKDLIGFIWDSTANTGMIAKVGQDGLSNSVSISSLQPQDIYQYDDRVIVVDLKQKQVVTSHAGTLVSKPFPALDTISSAGFYQGNLYALVAGGIQKFSDINQGNAVGKAWLATNTILPGDAQLIAVDGNVMVLTKSGALVTYYKGTKATEVQTSLTLAPDAFMMTSIDSPNFFVADRTLGRIHVLDKKSGALVRTYRISAPQKIVHAAVAPDDTVYFITQDNKVWRIK